VAARLGGQALPAAGKLKWRRTSPNTREMQSRAGQVEPLGFAMYAPRFSLKACVNSRAEAIGGGR
jgi:hypothetical protein